MPKYETFAFCSSQRVSNKRGIHENKNREVKLRGTLRCTKLFPPNYNDYYLRTGRRRDTCR